MSDSDSGSIPSVAQLRAHSLSGVVRHEIERLILSGELREGMRLNENAIAARFGVSRGPVREACRALAEIGLVRLIPNRGVFVRRMDRRDAEEVYDLRAGLIGLSAALLAPKLTQDQLSRLAGLVEAMEQAATADDHQGFNPLNLEFHEAMVEMTGNSRLLKTYRDLVKEFHLFRSHGLVQQGSLTSSNAEHRRMLEALAAGDPEGAYRAGSQHVANGKQRMMKALDQLAGENRPPSAKDPEFALMD
jgi:DNA-binding GntR family transcriptional regulator